MRGARALGRRASPPSLERPRAPATNCRPGDVVVAHRLAPSRVAVDPRAAKVVWLRGARTRERARFAARASVGNALRPGPSRQPRLAVAGKGSRRAWVDGGMGLRLMGLEARRRMGLCLLRSLCSKAKLGLNADGVRVPSSRGIGGWMPSLNPASHRRSRASSVGDTVGDPTVSVRRGFPVEGSQAHELGLAGSRL